MLLEAGLCVCDIRSYVEDEGTVLVGNGAARENSGVQEVSQLCGSVSVASRVAACGNFAHISSHRRAQTDRLSSAGSRCQGREKIDAGVSAEIEGGGMNRIDLLADVVSELVEPGNVFGNIGVADIDFGFQRSRTDVRSHIRGFQWLGRVIQDQKMVVGCDQLIIATGINLVYLDVLR